MKMNFMQEALEQEVSYLRKKRSIRSARTVRSLLDAIDGTYYDIFLEDGDVAYGYFSEQDGKIFAYYMVREDENERDSWTSTDKVEVYPTKKLEVICYPEDNVCCVAVDD